MSDESGAAVLPRWQRVYVAGCCATIAFALVYGAVDYLRLPRLWHDQHARTLVWATRGDGPAPAGYVGLYTWGFAAALAAGAIVWVALGARRTPLTERTLGLLLAWTMTAVLLVGGYFTWNNWP